MKVAVIGAGSWGTALSIVSTTNHNQTYLYVRNETKAEHIRLTRDNEYLPGVKVPEMIQITSSLQEALEGAEIVLLVTPSKYIRETLVSLEPYVTKEMILVGCSKGLERETGERVSEVIWDVVGHRVKGIVILSGPNHAEEIARLLPATTVVAGNEEVSKVVQQALSSDTFRVYRNPDIIGVELAATTKNIVALAAGIADGMELGDNLKAALLTRGLHEMTKFGVACGGQKETYAGLAGMGDLIATCMSRHSRNRAAGQKLANGETMEHIMTHSNMVVEGFFAVATVYEVAREKGIDMPITAVLYDILYHQKSPHVALTELMRRDVKEELA